MLTACAGTFAGQPTVTQDDLTQLSTVQEVLEQDAGNGKSYAYFWEAEDIEAAMSQLYEQQQAFDAQCEEWLQNAESMTPEELANEGFESIEQARESFEQSRTTELEALESWRKHLEREAVLDPVVSPQEAANRAGVLFEELYGIDLSQDVLELQCWESAADDGRYWLRAGAPRPVWMVAREEAADDVPFSTNYISCTLDGTTGEIIAVTYTPSAQELEERRSLPYPACFIVAGANESGWGRWNTEDASFAPMIAAATQTLKLLLSGSPLTGGAQVTDVREEVREYEDGINELWLYADCDDGKSYVMKVEMPYDPFSTEGAGTPYPMRGLRVWNDTYQ